MVKNRERERTLQAQASSQSNSQWSRPRRGDPKPPSNGGLRRSISYLFKHKRIAGFAYTALIIATLAQLAVPQLVQNMIDAVTKGAQANAVLSVPADQQTAKAFQVGVLTPDNPKLDQAKLNELTQNQANAESLLINAGLLIFAFALVRGISSFVQTYMAEKTSQGIAFDFRNEIFAKIQRLSFSYHDQNQTGKLMIRATDDVDKGRLFQ